MPQLGQSAIRLICKPFIPRVCGLLRSTGRNVPVGALAQFVETILLQAGRREEAYAQYAIEANQANSYLSTYRAIAKKYPEVDSATLFNDLIESTPGNEGQWFATAKTVKRFDLALALAQRSPCDPNTLIHDPFYGSSHAAFGRFATHRSDEFAAGRRVTKEPRRTATQRT